MSTTAETTRWADDDPTHRHLLDRRRGAVRELLADAGLWPLRGRRVADLGCGRGHSWEDVVAGESTRALGIDLPGERIQEARSKGLATVAGDLRALPLRTGSIDLALLFTVLSSVRVEADRRAITSAAAQALSPAGALLIYDLTVVPPNGRLSAVTTNDVRKWFPDSEVLTRRLTLMPPLARRLVPISPRLCDLLETLPWLRTHRLWQIRPRRSGAVSSSPLRT